MQRARLVPDGDVTLGPVPPQRAVGIHDHVVEVGQQDIGFVRVQLGDPLEVHRADEQAGRIRVWMGADEGMANRRVGLIEPAGQLPDGPVH